MAVLLAAFFLLCPASQTCRASQDAEGRRALVYSADFSFSPYRILTEEGFSGFEVDITRAIFKDSLYTVRYHERDWVINENPYDDASSQWDLIGWRIIDPIVQARYLNSDQLFQYHWGAFTLPGKGLLKFEDLGQYKIGIVGRKFPFAMLDRLELKEGRDFVVYASQGDALRALTAGFIDIWYDERMAASSMLIKTNLLSGVEYHEELEVVKPVGYAIRVAPENVDLQKFINKRIGEIKADGQYEYLYKLYFGANSPEYLSEQRRKTAFTVMGLTLVVLLLTFLSAVLIRLLRRHARLGQELGRAVGELRLSREQYQLAVESADEGIVYCNSETNIPFVSPRFYAILGLDPAVERDLNGLFLDVLAVTEPEDHAKLFPLQDAVNNRRPVAFSTELRVRGGDNTRWALMHIKTQLAEGRYILGGTIADISGRKEQEAVIVFYAECDPLTGIYNRRKMGSLCESMVETCREEGKSLSLVFMDLDNFKTINDTLGHQAGDRVLQAFAEETRRLLPKDAVFGRVGGDEFLVLLPHKYRALAVMQTILASLNTLASSPAAIGSSIGIAFFPQHGATLSELVKSADAASAQAKARGKNRIEIYDPDGMGTESSSKPPRLRSVAG